MKQSMEVRRITHLFCIGLFLMLVDFVNSVSVKKVGPFPYLNSKNSEYGFPYLPISVNFRDKCGEIELMHLLIMMRQINQIVKIKLLYQ